LEACPFCGSDDVVPALLSYQRKVHCKNCGASGQGFHHPRDGKSTEQQAIAAWNTRTPPKDA
jgi:Lar family restriction alleviation protein